MIKRRVGLSTIESLVMIAIFALLVAILLPLIPWSRRAPRRVNIPSSLKQRVVGTHDYQSTFIRLSSPRVPASRED
jgi:hypothetical protein